MQKVIYLVGIPGSGKSSFAEELAKKEQAIVLSSDTIRHELFGEESKQKKTNLVYRTLYERVNELLLERKNVIIDATNVERERRMFSLQKINRLGLKNVRKICFYFDTPYDICLERNQKRSRQVEGRILEKMRKNLEYPLLGEGFDDIQIVHVSGEYEINKEEFLSLVASEVSYEELYERLKTVKPFKEMYRFNQENPHHQFLLCEHTSYVYQYVNEYYEGEDKLILQLTALFHDSGKPFCKKYKPLRGNYSYYQHENVSAQMASHFLNQLGFDKDLVKQVVELVQLHMLISFGGDEGASEIYHLLGGEMLTKLYFFREGDMFAK